MTVQIALAQIGTTPDVVANLEQIRAQAAAAAAGGARLVLLPEAATCSFDGDPGRFATEQSAEAHDRIAGWAAELDIALVVGSFTTAEDGRVLNTTIVALPDGTRHRYDKIHLFDAFGHRESDTIAPGDSPTVFEFDGVRYGLATCYDIRFPELFTGMARAGAQVILLGASWGDGPGKAVQWDLLTRARALDSTTWLAAVGQSPRDRKAIGERTASPLGVGHSALVGPDGTDTLRLGTAPMLAHVEVDVDLVDPVRAGIPVLENARLNR